MALDRRFVVALVLCGLGACRRAPEVAALPERPVPESARCAATPACVRDTGLVVRAESSAPFADVLLLDVLNELRDARVAHLQHLGTNPAPTMVLLQAADSVAATAAARIRDTLVVTLYTGPLPTRDDPAFGRMLARRARWDASGRWVSEWESARAAGSGVSRTPAWVRTGLQSLIADHPRVGASRFNLLYQEEDRLPLGRLVTASFSPTPPTLIKLATRDERAKRERSERGANGRGTMPAGGMMSMRGDGQQVRLPIVDLQAVQAASVLAYLSRTLEARAFRDLLRRVATGSTLPEALRATPKAPTTLDALERAWLDGLR